MATDICELSEISIFRGLGRKALKEIESVCVPRDFIPKQRVYNADNSVGDIHFVVSGRFIARCYGYDGKEISFGIFEAGECFGDFGVVEGGVNIVKIEALTDATTMKLSANDFFNAGVRYPSIMAAMLSFHGEIINCLAGRVFEMSTMPVSLRVRRHLLRLASIQGRSKENGEVLIDPFPRHQEIASAVSTHREAVTREMRHLATAGIIETGRNLVRIPNLKLLEGIIEADAQALSSH